MKILHTADTHIGTFPGPSENGKNLRMRDTTNCMVSLANSAISESPDMIIISGDLFHRSRLWADEMLVEIQIAADWLNDLAKVAPVCLLYGTPNHDNLEAFNNLARALPENVHIFTHPERRIVQTASGPAQVCALPGFDRGFFRAQNPGVPREEENAVYSNALAQIVMGLRSQCTPDMPSVLMAHYTVPGADLESGQVQIFSQSEPMLSVDTLNAAAFSLVALGHIHKPQLVNGFQNVYYAGAINRFNFNDEDQARGFWYHEIGSNDLTSSRFVATPARNFHTVVLADDRIDEFNTLGWTPAIDDEGEEIKGSIVRVLYSCTDEHEKALNKSALEKHLYEKGAFWVQEITPAEIVVTLDRKAMDEASTPEENLITYLQERGVDEERIPLVVEFARPIIAEAIAKTRDKLSTGILRPVKIEVSNYRNYREASFDFTDITMCTINGQNGAGKSSLFMDAIVDCLYEEPREADLTGWIRADDDARSGSITFTFSLGEKLYRVSRTRARSGKATLNLSECVDDSWENRSCERMRDTQDEIVSLLGMHLDMIKSCALIMQDQYGVFLEAGKEQRMETLAAMLGLGVYEIMEESARTKSTDAAREIRAAQDQEDRLADSLAREAPALAAKEEALAAIEKLTRDIEGARQQENEARGHVDRAKEANDRIAVLRSDLQTKQAALSQAERDHDEVQMEIKRLALVMGDEAVLTEKSQEYETALAGIEDLNSKHLAAQRAYDAAKHKAEGTARLTKERDGLKERVQKLTEDREQAEQASIALMPFKGSAAKRDEAATRIRDLEAQEALRTDLLRKQRETAASMERCSTEWKHTLAAKETEIEGLAKRATLLHDSKCIDPDEAKCVFLEDAMRSRDALPALRDALKALRDKAEYELTMIRMDDADIQTKIAKLATIPDQLMQLRTEHAQHIKDAAQYEQHTFFLDRISAIDEEYVKLKIDIDNLTREIESASAADNQVEALETALADAFWNLSQASGKVNSLRIYADQARALPEIKERHSKAVEREARLGAAVLEGVLTCAQVQKDIDALTGAAANLPQLRLDLDAIGRKIGVLDQQKGEANARLGAADKELEIVATVKAKREELRRTITALSGRAAIYADLKQAFSRDGIPHNIIRSILPILESTSNSILSQMTGGKMLLDFVTERTLKSNAKKEVTTLDIFIEESGRTRLPYLSKSGGEKVKVSLSVVLALAEIMSRRAGIQVGFLFIDEPPFLDDMGTQAYCDALDAIRSRYPGHIIMAITHDPTMKARFPQSIDIVRTDEGSKVVYN